MNIIKEMLALLLIGSICLSQDIDWAQQDLDFIHDAIRDNHPGMYNELDPDFKEHFSLHYQIAQDQLKACATDEQKIETIRSFITSFNDAHMQIRYKEFQKNSTHEQVKRNPFAITDLDNSVCWITLPTFQPNAQEKESFQTIIDTLAQKQQTFTSNDCIVFDIRGNGGGNSMFARDIVFALFGQDYARYCADTLYKDVSVDWRASQGNITYFQQVKEKNSSDSQQTEFVQWLNHVIEGMQQALSDEKIYFTQKNNKQDEVLSEQPINPLKARIIVIVDNRCFSAALDFIDYLKAMDHSVILIGETTGADSLYMDINQSELPSKKGNFALPMKVYRNRIRGHNEPYIPDIVYQGDINDTVALQQFVKSLLITE